MPQKHDDAGHLRSEKSGNHTAQSESRAAAEPDNNTANAPNLMPPESLDMKNPMNVIQRSRREDYDHAQDVSKRSVIVGDYSLEYDSKEEAAAIRKVLPPALGLLNKIPTLNSLLEQQGLGKGALEAEKALLSMGIKTLLKGQKKAKMGIVDHGKDYAAEKTKEAKEKIKNGTTSQMGLISEGLDLVSDSTESISKTLTNTSILIENPAISDALLKAGNELGKTVEEGKTFKKIKSLSAALGFVNGVAKMLNSGNDKEAQNARIEGLKDASTKALEQAGYKNTAKGTGAFIDLHKYFGYDKMTPEQKMDLNIDTTVNSLELIDAAAQAGIEFGKNNTGKMATRMAASGVLKFAARWAGPAAIAAEITLKTAKWILGEAAEMNRGFYMYSIKKELEPFSVKIDDIKQSLFNIKRNAILASANPTDEKLQRGLQIMMEQQMSNIKYDLVKMKDYSPSSLGLKRELDFLHNSIFPKIASLGTLGDSTNAMKLQHYTQVVLGKFNSILDPNKIEKIAGFNFRKKKQKERLAKENVAEIDQKNYDKYGTVNPKEIVNRKKQIRDGIEKYSKSEPELALMIRKKEMGHRYDTLEFEAAEVMKNQETIIQHSPDYNVMLRYNTWIAIRDSDISDPKSDYYLYKKKAAKQQLFRKDMKMQYLVYLAEIKAKDQIDMLPKSDRALVFNMMEDAELLDSLKKDAYNFSADKYDQAQFSN